MLAIARLIYDTLIFHSGIFHAYYQPEWEKVLGIKLLPRDIKTINEAVAMLESRGIMTHACIRIRNKETNKFSLTIPLPPKDDWGIGSLPWEQKYRAINRKLFAELRAIKKIDLLDKPNRKKPGRKKKQPPEIADQK